jgi:hypothetical protein
MSLAARRRNIGSFEAVGHRVEQIGQIRRLLVVAAGRASRDLAHAEPPCASATSRNGRVSRFAT